MSASWNNENGVKGDVEAYIEYRNGLNGFVEETESSGRLPQTLCFLAAGRGVLRFCCRHGWES